MTSNDIICHNDKAEQIGRNLMGLIEPNGKLKKLIDIFKNINEDNDETEVKSIIQLLDRHCWNVHHVSLLLKLEWQYKVDVADLAEFEDILDELYEKTKSPIISEEEKLNRVVEMAKSPRVHYNYETIKAISESLKYDEDFGLH